jgi:hypothetical protein
MNIFLNIKGIFSITECIMKQDSRSGRSPWNFSKTFPLGRTVHNSGQQIGADIGETEIVLQELPVPLSFLSYLE